MRKTYVVLVVSFLIATITTNAQTEKKEPPPPPPKPKVEMEKITPPKIVKDEEVQVKEPPVITVKGKLADDFYKRNPSVSDISRKGNTITLKMKDGTKQEYNVNKEDEMKSFTDQYGESPIPPPPPPPKVIKTKSRA